MDRQAAERWVTVVLRVVGVLTVFVGAILITQTIIQLISVHWGSSGLPQGLPPGMSISLKGTAGRMGAWAIAGLVAVMAWGGLLARVSKPIAGLIASE